MYKLKIFIITSFLFMQDFDQLEFGNQNHLDIITWNIEWFPKNEQITIDYVAQIIEALDVDLIAMQELDDTVLFNQMINDLDNYNSYYESSWFAGLAFIYKSNEIEINNIYEIYTTSEYWSPFPRSPMVLDMNFLGENYIIINNHFKCCGDGILDLNDNGDEEMRRYIANNLLKEYIELNFNENNVILLGDLNDSLTDEVENNIFQMFIDDSENYLFVDMPIAQGDIIEWSFPNWPSHLDHIIISNELFSIFENGNSYCETIKIDDYFDGGFYEYDQNISDHRPIALKLAVQNSILGDINEDSLINIQDILLIINIILSNEYNYNGDINTDNTIDILDVIQIINIILYQS
ncbi:MAG: hypothetical protein CMF96_00110 [Candidatus Marinimicrobia bacterium]|nr:hypothetical protein [Candidatus Neomarinimicrobiota bacterium]